MGGSDAPAYRSRRGLYHFPKTEILLSRAECDAASGWHGRLEGYLPLPAWFSPTLIDFAPTACGPFPTSHTLTQAGDIVLVATPGHTSGHLSVIVQENASTLFLAGDTSYTQQLMVQEATDDVCVDEQAARQTLEHIHTYTQQTPVVYLPSHDPASAERLAARTVVNEANLVTPQA